MPGQNGVLLTIASTPWSGMTKSPVPEGTSLVQFLYLRCSGVEAPQYVSSVLIMTMVVQHAGEAGNHTSPLRRLRILGASPDLLRRAHGPGWLPLYTGSKQKRRQAQRMRQVPGGQVYGSRGKAPGGERT